MDGNANPMKVHPGELARELAQRIRAAQEGRTVRPLIIRGRPGIGKTQITHAAARAAGVPLEVMDLVVRDPTDLGGIPYPTKDGLAGWLEPEWSRRCRAAPHGVAFFDDLGAAAPAVQAAALRLILEGEVGATRLPAGWLRVAATNRAADKTFHHRISSALATRFTWLDLEVTVDDWASWAVPAGVDPRIIGFLRFMGERALHTTPVQDGPSACPRTWEFLSDYLQSTGEPLRAAILGTVGPGAGGEFLAFLAATGDLPDPRGVLEGKGVPFPERNDQGYVLCAALASAYARDPARWAEPVAAYARTIPAEFSVLLITDCLRAHEGRSGPNPMAHAAAFQVWADEHRDVVMCTGS